MWRRAATILQTAAAKRILLARALPGKKRRRPSNRSTKENIKPTHVLAGSVSSDGSPAGFAQGYYVRALGGGTYIVEFETPMENVPAVVVTQNYPSWSAFDSPGGDPRDNAILLAIDAKGFMVVTGDSHGAHKDRDFCFIAAA